MPWAPPRQITDSFLLALAVAHGGRFVSFDLALRKDLVPDASQALADSSWQPLEAMEP